LAQKMLHVKKHLCFGCGLCEDSCPQQAIRLLGRHPEIDQSRCNQCGLCIDACPQGAIVELVPVSIDELQSIVISLKQRTDDLIKRIGGLKNQHK